jgi:hypothetical protein
MSEIIVTGYKRLFEIRLLHHYWLDEGANVFDNITLADREKRLLTYDRRPILSIEPTQNTANALAGLKAVYKDTALGAVVAIKSDVVVPNDAVFEFVVTVADARFHNYSLHTFKKNDIKEIFYAPENKVYRYKENVFVLSNRTGSKVSTDLYLSKGYTAFTTPATAHPAEALFANGTNLLQVTNEVGGTIPPYGAAALLSKLPIFVHHEDIPVVVPPAGMTGAPARGLLLTDQYPDNTYMLIRVAAKHPSDTAFDCTTAAGVAKATPPVFQVRFKNRTSTWRYKNKSNPGVAGVDDGQLPMTFFGNAHTKPKALISNIKVDFDTPGPSQKITRIVSEIFI